MNRGLVYDWAQFSLATGESDYSVVENIAALFNNVPLAKSIVIFHNKEIGLKFNSTLMPKMTLGIARSPFQSPERFLEVKNIFLSNSTGSTVTMEILIW